MPVQQTKSSFAAKMGNRLDTAIKAHATDETDYGFQRLPPGINNGVAQLTKCYFEEYKKGSEKEGKYYFRAEGTVVFPEYVPVNGLQEKVAGRQTSIMIGIHETKTKDTPPKVTSEADRIAEVMNEMRKLGGDTSTITNAAGLEAMAQALQDAKPYFKFATSVRKARTPQESDGVWENWNGAKGVEDYGEQMGNLQTAGVAEQGAPETPPPDAKPVPQTKPASSPKAGPAAKPQPAAASPPPPSKPPAPAAVPAPAEEPAGDGADEGGGEGGDVDLDAILELANQKNAPAQQQLVALAVSCGYEQEVVDSAQTWEDVVQMIRDADAGAGGEGGDEGGGDWTPAVTEVYGYRPVNPKTKAKSEKKVEVEILAVNTEAKTVDLRNNDNKKLTYNGVPFADLESAD